MQRGADVVIRGGPVWTVDDRTPWAEAVAVRDGRIEWIGDDADAVEHIGPGTEVLDASGGMVLPGIIDSHNHVRLGADGDAVALAGAGSLPEVHRRIREWLDARPGAEWVEADGFNYGAIEGGRMPTAEDLEGATDGKPAFILTYDAHNAWLNREALARFGVTRETDRLPFGVVEKDPRTGEPTGMIGDFAVMGIERAGQAALAEVLPGYAPERQYLGLLSSLDMATAFGITTIVEPQNSVDDLPMFARARDEGRLRSRLVAALFHPPGTTDAELDEFAAAARTYDDDRFRAGPIKLYIDDVVEPHTAAFFEPYATEPKTTGETFYEPAEFAELVAKLDGRGFQTFTHSIGDRGIRTVLDALAYTRATNGPRDARHQLVHVECPHPDDIARFAELDVVACMQPRHWAPEITVDWRAAVGPERAEHAAPFAALHRAGAPLAFSSDWNVAEMDPLVGIYSALTRADLTGRDAWSTHQTVDLATAIHAYTMGGAYANFCEDARGSVTPGKAADLVVLSRNLFELEPLEMLDATVEATIVSGEVVHRRSTVDQDRSAD